MTGLLKKTRGILTEVVGEERLLFDAIGNEAFLLEPLSARVYELCDGNRTRRQIENELNDGAESSQAVSRAIQDLIEHGFLHELEDQGLYMTRRGLLQNTAKAAVLPLFMTVALPRASAASSMTCLEDDALGANSMGCNASAIPGGPPPTGCCACCGTNSTCGVNCAGCDPMAPACFCMACYLCANNDCLTGRCTEDTLMPALNDCVANNGGNQQRSCDLARQAAAAAGQDFYFCCEACS